MTNEEITRETSLDRLTRRLDQAYELAGCARMDQDYADERRMLEEAKSLRERIRELSA